MLHARLDAAIPTTCVYVHTYRSRSTTGPYPRASAWLTPPTSSSKPGTLYECLTSFINEYKQQPNRICVATMVCDNCKSLKKDALKAASTLTAWVSSARSSIALLRQPAVGCSHASSIDCRTCSALPHSYDVLTRYSTPSYQCLSNTKICRPGIRFCLDMVCRSWSCTRFTACKTHWACTSLSLLSNLLLQGSPSLQMTSTDSSHQVLSIDTLHRKRDPKYQRGCR